MPVKGYPKTRFSIEDKTNTLEITTNSVGTNMPLAMQPFTSDRGPENWSVITSFKDFIDKYGEISFERHGQPQLVVADILKSGGAVLAKRIVADDATLANITIKAKVVTETVDVAVEDPDGTVTIDTKRYTVTNTTEKFVYFYAEYDSGEKTFNSIINKYAVDMENTKFRVSSATSSSSTSESNTAIFNLFTITAIGRGTSNLSFTINPIYNNNASYPNYLLYSLKIYRDNKLIEDIKFSFNPNRTIEEVSYAMNPRINLNSNEIIIKNYENQTQSFIESLATCAKINNRSLSANELVEYDFINGRDRSGKNNIGNIVVGEGQLGKFSTTTGEAGSQTTTLSTKDLWLENMPSDLYDMVNNVKTIHQNVIIPNNYSNYLGNTEDNNYINFSFATAADSDTTHTNTTNGSNGSMSDNPISNAISSTNNGTYTPCTYENLLLNAFGKRYDTSNNSIINLTGDVEIIGNTTNNYLQFDPVIYDIDKYKIDFICDCGFPKFVKRAIVDLVEFRGDMVYLADIGADKLSNANAIITKSNEIFTDEYKSKYVAIYHNVVDIYNPYSGKQISVTIPYLLASKMVNHISNGAGRPFAGMLNNITFPEVIKNSVNYIPRKTPIEDYKQLLVNNNINYLNMYNDLLVMDTLYVNQSEYTQLSYLSNVMAIQQIIKNIRNRCPAVRYRFMDGDDLERYIDDANAVINQYNSFFKSISISYMTDPEYESNNIFYAVLKVQFRNFIQEEYFKIIAIS